MLWEKHHQAGQKDAKSWSKLPKTRGRACAKPNRAGCSMTSRDWRVWNGCHWPSDRWILGFQVRHRSRLPRRISHLRSELMIERLGLQESDVASPNLHEAWQTRVNVNTSTSLEDSKSLLTCHLFERASGRDMVSAVSAPASTLEQVSDHTE
jgi:hypothetical protein